MRGSGAGALGGAASGGEAPGPGAASGVRGRVRDRWEVVLAGEGGQGLVVAGVILGEAAVIEGLEAVQSQWVFGAAARGSLSRSEVIIGCGEICFPRVRRAGVLLALTQEALRRHLSLAAPDGLVVVDQDHVHPEGLVGPPRRVRRAPVLATAARLGLARSANVTALGLLVGLTGAVKPESVEQALKERFGPGAGPNLQAFRAGLALAAEAAADGDGPV